MPFVLEDSAGTGTESWPFPLAPSAVTRTCQEPEVIIQSDPVKNCGSSFERCARSGTGANFAPGPVSGVGTM